MSEKLTKQERDKFLHDLEAINLESDSEMEDSFYQKECKRMQTQINNLKAQQNWSVLQQLKKNVKQEDDMMTEYEKDRQQLHKITSNQTKNVIDDNIINAIKQKVAVQNNNSLLSLADEMYNQSLLANPSKLQPQQILNNSSFHKVKNNLESKMKAQESAILKKIEVASQLRQHDAMEQEDKLSMKNEFQTLSQLFKNRFIRPSFPMPKQQDTIIKLYCTKIASSFVRLVPQPISEQTVLPKNAPEIALKVLKSKKKKNLKSTGNGEMKIFSKKILKEKVQQQQITIFKAITTKKQNQIDKIFIEYIKNIKPLIINIEGIAKQYHPHFLRYLQEEEKNLNFQLQQESIKQGKQRVISQVASLENSNSLCQLKLTFEKLTKLKGIQFFTNLQQVQLQFNLLNSLDGIHSCKKIIQLNLSHNRINNISPLNSLPWLRFLNIQHNLIETIAPQCSSLEALLASNNRIHEINLIDLKQLRILQLNHNRLHSLPQLQLIGLQQLGLSHNQLESIKGLENLLILKKLDVSHNRIDNIQNITFLYLNSIDLSHNWLTNITQLFLPCLQQLQLTYNRLTIRPKGLAYLPNLKELNIDDNRLEGFGYIWWLLRFSRQMQILRYGNNQCFLVLREKVRQVYQSILYKNLPALKILNDSATDRGLAQYYQENYNIYSDGSSFFQHQGPILMRVQSNIRLLLRQMTFSSELQKNCNPFSRDQAYINYLWQHKVAGLKRVISLTDTKQKQVIIPPSLFHIYDRHQQARRNLFHLLRGALISKIYKRKRKIKYFLKIQPKIIEKLNTFNIQYGNSQIKKALAKFKFLLRGINETQAAIIIQKVWRGYIRRKLYLKILGKKPKGEDSDFQDVDTDFFNNQLQRVQFDIDLQGFEDIIIRPQVFELLQAKQKEAATKPIKESKEENKASKVEKNPLNNNFLDSRTRLNQPHRLEAENEAEKLMREWHIKDPKVLKALQYKQQKKEQMKRKQLQKNMTAAQRYQRFKRGGH